jgi:hypothetical protein
MEFIEVLHDRISPMVQFIQLDLILNCHVKVLGFSYFGSVVVVLSF